MLSNFEQKGGWKVCSRRCVNGIFVFLKKNKKKKILCKRHYEPHPSCPSHRIRDTKARDESFRRSDEDDGISNEIR